VFLRWMFLRPEGGVATAVRAVDTATLPAAQGRGVFTRLTTTAVDELREQGVDFVFNTPNDRSRPGYLKMGWQVVGRVPGAAPLPEHVEQVSARGMRICVSVPNAASSKETSRL